MSRDERSDAVLLAASGRGDDAALGVLVRRYVRTATLLAFQFLGDQDDAEDVVQEAFTIVYRKAREFDAARPFAPWFFAIVRKIASHRRTREERRTRLLRLWGIGRGESNSAGVEAAALSRVDTEAALRAMNDLSPMQRACFELIAIRGLSIEEVAAMHGISESTVRQHVYRARASLRNQLERRQ